MWYYFVGVLETHTQHSVYAYALCKSLNTFHDGIIVVLITAYYFTTWIYIYLAILLMEIMFFVVSNLMNIIKVNTI